MDFEVIPVQYDNVQNFYGNRLSVVFKDDKAGVIDLNGNIVVPIRYNEIRRFMDGMWVVRSDEGFGFANYEGEEVIPPQYEIVSGFMNGIAVVRDNEDAPFYFINKSGKVINETSYNIRYDVYDGGMIYHDDVYLEHHSTDNRRSLYSR
ncbi:hypothetical protein B1748_34680 [Paenibacillus sp. MY03]|nr:hypothetical protein B1748_34680 [Paenibacillus sp. MY03]